MGKIVLTISASEIGDHFPYYCDKKLDASHSLSLKDYKYFLKNFEKFSISRTMACKFIFPLSHL